MTDLDGAVVSGAVSLREAIARYRMEPGAPINTFDWYRRSAHESGYVSLAGTHVRAFKQGRSWFVDVSELAAALDSHRAMVRRRHQMTVDLAQGLIHGLAGDVIDTDWGGYKNHGAFRFQWSDQVRTQQISDGSWYCNSCNKPAHTEHNGEECHRCRDWTPCGRDCRLSRVLCVACGASMAATELGSLIG